MSRLDNPKLGPFILYQSQQLSAVARPWMSVFEAERLLHRLRDEAKLPILSMCGFCQRIAWPSSTPAEWIEAEEYYARGGASDVRISHGVCRDCAGLMDTQSAPTAKLNQGFRRCR